MTTPTLRRCDAALLTERFGDHVTRGKSESYSDLLASSLPPFVSAILRSAGGSARSSEQRPRAEAVADACSEGHATMR